MLKRFRKPAVTFKPSKLVLLTGAGFTKSFGGPLSGEMWAVILGQPEIQQNRRLHKLLLEDFSYESLYETVSLSEDYLPAEKAAFTAAVKRAYRQMHEVVCGHWQLKANEACGVIISLFAPQSSNERGFFFTLNQDLLVEQYYYRVRQHLRATPLKIPGLDNRNWFAHGRHVSVSHDDRIQLPGEAEVAKLNDDFEQNNAEPFVYVKLHGSLGWKAADGSDVMIIGQNKNGMIAREPFLRWQLEIFKGVLKDGDCRLVIIGYGFGDPHINEILADAIDHNRLRLFIVSPLEPEEFQRTLQRRHNILFGHNAVSTLWGGVFGYHRGTLEDLYIEGQWDLSKSGEAFFEQVML
jgi:hypothetical protein